MERRSDTPPPANSLDCRRVIFHFLGQGIGGSMKLSFFEPRIELKPYIQSIWVFESQARLPLSGPGIFSA